MNKLIKKVTLLFTLSLVSVALFSQDVPDTFPTETSQILDYYNAVLSGLIFLWGMIAKAFKLDQKVDQFVFVIIAGAITLSGIFIVVGFSDGIQAAFTLLTTMGIFDIFKGIQKQTTKQKPE